MRITIRDVARASGVGVTTVSRALNNQPGVSATTAERVRAKAAELGYRPNLSARSLRSAHSDTVLVVIKGPANPFFTEALELIERRLRSDGYVVTIVRVQHDDDELEAALNAASAARTCGMILLGGWSDVDPDGWAKIPVPAVLCTVPEIFGVDRGEYSAVAVDDEHAMGLIVDHLVGLGHKRIAFIGPVEGEQSIGAVRMNHFIAALSRHGIEVDPALVLRGSSLESSYSHEYGARLAREFVAGGGDATTIVGMSDAIAIGAIRALADADVAVPDEMCVTGFDGIEMSRYTVPRLTTVRQPLERIVEETCDLLARLIDGGDNRQILVKGELIASESTGSTASLGSGENQ